MSDDIGFGGPKFPEWSGANRRDCQNEQTQNYSNYGQAAAQQSAQAALGPPQARQGLWIKRDDVDRALYTGIGVPLYSISHEEAAMTARNQRVQQRWDELRAEAKHGIYETLFQIVREEVEFATKIALAPYANAVPPSQLSEDGRRQERTAALTMAYQFAACRPEAGDPIALAARTVHFLETGESQPADKDSADSPSVAGP
jgi:hypothetical protein